MKSIKNLKQIYLNKIKNNESIIPRIIHVETRSKCNGTCSFCPASVKFDKREDLLMPIEYIEKVIDDLSSIDYKNRLSFYNNNEPFLDNRISDIVQLARNKLPKAYLELKTNGTLLNTEAVISIFNSGLDTLYISNYSKSKKLHKNIYKIKRDLDSIRRFKGHFENGTYYSRIIISFRNIDEVIGTRAGNSPNKSIKKNTFSSFCLRPMEMMTINPKGDVSVCSEDMLCKINMGNITTHRLLDIWNSDIWNDFRKELLNGNRSYSPICPNCDFKGYNYEILMENGLYKKNMDKNFLVTTIKKVRALFQT